MLFVLFQLGKNRYALEANCVVEVLPLLELKHVPQQPRGVAGIFVYRGQPVPALDLCELTLGRPALEHLSTRIIIVQHRKTTGESQLIGLIAERATGTLRRDEKAFVDAGGVKLASAAFLGPILMDDQGVIQLLDAQKLLDEGEQMLRLTHSAEASHAPH
jgi:chemotaxis-related protein WspB